MKGAYNLHDASEGPNIGLCAVALSVEHLRGQVVGSPTDCSEEKQVHDRRIKLLSLLKMHHAYNEMVVATHSSGIPQEGVKLVLKLCSKRYIQLSPGKRFS